MTCYCDDDPTLAYRLAAQAREQGDLLRAALWNFISTVEATGGVVEDRYGNAAPQADADWLDLGESYLAACRALDHEPRIEHTDDRLDGRAAYEEEPL